MKFSKQNMKKYNVMETEEVCNCSICNKKTNYKDYWSDNSFCSTECQDKYYDWEKKQIL